MSQVPDWRNTARGAHYYLDEMANLERELGVLMAEAEATSGTGGEVGPLIPGLSQRIQRMGELTRQAHQERQVLDQWIANETRRLFTRNMKQQFASQFDEQYEIYQMIAEASPDTLQYFNEHLAALGQAR